MDQHNQQISHGQIEMKPGRAGAWFGALLVTLALAASLGTFLVMAGLTPVAPVHRVVVGLFALNATIILALLLLVATQAVLLFRARRRGAAGSGLHARIVSLFSFVAVVPAILVAVVATITLERGLEPWFSQRMRDVIFKSIEVADTYTRHQCIVLGREVRLMADDIQRTRELLTNQRQLVEDFITARATALGLPIVKVVNRAGDVTLRARLSVIDEPPNPPGDAFDDAQSTGDPICAGAQDTRVFTALMKLPDFEDRFLLVARQVDELTVAFPTQAREAAAEYLSIDARRYGVQIAFASMYALIALTILLSAIWFGQRFANALVSPIRRLIHATDQVGGGNFYVQVPVRRQEGDWARLGETFNKMTAELRRQRDGLVTANDLLDRRRRFTETVLAGVSAGVIGLDGEDRVTLLNRSAEELLGSDRRAIGRAMAELAPELAEVIGEARQARLRSVSAQIVLLRSGRERTLNVRVSRDGDGPGVGLVVTIDDITDLVAAQRTSAWADVARRIAHEIKNPLTPIQLSAERIRRKFGRVIVEDRQVLEQCTDTIVRQVEDIRRMVDEFSSFARMPKPQPAPDDLAAMIREVAFMMKVGYPDVAVAAAGADGTAAGVFDRRLLSQALTNLVKNAIESAQASPHGEGEAPAVEIALHGAEEAWMIDVIDNGKGFPADRQRLLEPYMTTREGGTGLGLPIVSKILEDHGGRIELLDREDGRRGALVRAWIPFQQEGEALTERGRIAETASAKTP